MAVIPSLELMATTKLRTTVTIKYYVLHLKCRNTSDNVYKRKLLKGLSLINNKEVITQMTVPTTYLDVSIVYYTLKLFYERTHDAHKTVNEQEQARYDLYQYIKGIKHNIHRLPSIWYLVFIAKQDADTQTLALHFLRDCKPI